MSDDWDYGHVHLYTGFYVILIRSGIIVNPV